MKKRMNYKESEIFIFSNKIHPIILPLSIIFPLILVLNIFCDGDFKPSYVIFVFFGFIAYTIFECIFRLKFRISLNNDSIKIFSINKFIEIKIDSISTITKINSALPSAIITFNDKEVMIPNYLKAIKHNQMVDVIDDLAQIKPGINILESDNYENTFEVGLYDVFFEPNIKSIALKIYAFLHSFLTIPLIFYLSSSSKNILSSFVMLLGYSVIYWFVFKIIKNPVTYKIYYKYFISTFLITILLALVASVFLK
jgi:hypothetical protein